MKGKIKYVFFILLLFPLILVSCVKLISDEFPDFETVPALNCILISGENVRVHLSLAEKLDSIELTLVDNASVQIRQGESESILLQYQDNGIYTSDNVVESGAPYHVSVILEGYPEITANDSVPTFSSISILSQTNTARLSEEGYFVAGVELRFVDDPQKEDYYELIIYKRMEDYLGLTYPFNEQSKILLNEGFEPYTTESLVFSDELIDEEEEVLDLFYGSSYSTHSSGGARYQTFREHTLIAELRHISKEYYIFKKSQYFYENTRYADFIEGTATAYPVYSNVKNGLGIMASYSSSVDSIFVEADTIQLSK